MQIHNKLNNTHKALMHFSWAMDLDPKGANSQIKDALDRSMNRAAQEDLSKAPAAEAPAVDESSVEMVAQPANISLQEDEDEVMQDDSGRISLFLL